MTYFELDRTIKDVFGDIPMVNSVYNDSMEWQTNKDVRYVSVAFDLQSSSVTDGFASYTFYFVCGDVSMDDESDRISHYSQLMGILYDGLQQLGDIEDIEIDETINFNFASIKYMDVLDVCTCGMQITVPMTIDCE